MQILLFARDGIGCHIREAVTRAVPEIEVISALNTLVSRLRHRFVRPDVLVLIAGSNSEFIDIQQIKWLLNDICTILILPDRNNETVDAGLSLQPRFMGCLDDDADEITSVLCKMLTGDGDGRMRLRLRL